MFIEQFRRYMTHGETWLTSCSFPFSPENGDSTAFKISAWGRNGLALTAWTNIISGTNFPLICLLPSMVSVSCDVSKQCKTASHRAQAGTLRECFLFISSVKCLIFLNLLKSKPRKMTRISSNLDKAACETQMIYLILLIGLTWNLFGISDSEDHNCSLKDYVTGCSASLLFLLFMTSLS